MTFILTAVCVEPARKPHLPASELLVVPAVHSERAPARAGFLGGLTRYFAEPVDGIAYHLLTDEGGGYETSNVFFAYGDDDVPARLIVPDSLRAQVQRLLTELLSASGCGRVILIAEDNGHVTDPDLDAEGAETIDRLGPITSEEFWRLLELREVYEDSVIEIYQREGAGPTRSGSPIN